ncbi:hypothetical protein ACFO1B_53260 [Dactylosporangium siamense]|uniref:Uncharacterized protein n=1 Tax=Dactylosporangium siamense TaxID=685454 RepID=A0A919UHV8_9ACTN|nr:hypothetical protein [Dactylosporangium siamense]GIG52796.1 hypothetical protein Dsi01nite_108370 [Dactylosporangium siamense]
MGTSWRIVLGALSGVVAAVIWAVSLAIYQPYMQPDGFWTDPATGDQYPEIGSNNTYWPRDIRQLAILLAFVGVVLVCRANVRGILAAAVGTVVWIGVDLALDRFDVSGGTTAVQLAIGGAVGFVVIAIVARFVSTDEPGSEFTGHLLATVAAVCAATTVLITTPWEEPVTDAEQVQVENALSLLKVGLVLMFAAVALALLPLGRIVWMVPFAGVAALAAWPATATYGLPGMLGLLFLPAGAATAVAAARGVPPLRLLGVLVACALALIPVYVLLYIIGSAIGGAMTSLADNPPINSADTDLSLSFAALMLGLVFAVISHLLTRPAVEAAAPLAVAQPE